MQQNIKKKLTKFATIGLSGAMLLFSTPLTYADAAETQNTVVTNAQEVANQALQAYLADSQGLLVKNATVEQLQLPFSPDQYYGRSLLTEEGKKAWDYVVKELLAFNSANDYPNLTTRSDGHGKFTINLKAAGITAPESDIKKFNKYLNASDARMFHIRNWNQEYTKDESGNVETVTFYIPDVFMGDNDYQNTLMGMEAYTSEVLSVVDPRMTDAQKVRALYYKYRSGMSYGSGTQIGNAIGALTYQKAICGGFSAGFLYILQRAGLEAIYLTGDTSGGYHAWNNVKVDGQWYFLDSTWGGDSWLLKGQSSLTSHKPRTTQHFEPLPTLSETNYDLNKTAWLAPEKYEETSKAAVDSIVAAVTKALNSMSPGIADLGTVSTSLPAKISAGGKPLFTQFLISNLNKELSQLEISGKVNITINNQARHSNAQAIINNGLTITHQALDSTPEYQFVAGKFSQVQSVGLE